MPCDTRQHFLQELVLSMTKLADAQPLAGLRMLRKLNLSFCPISDLRPLVNLVRLRELLLGGTKVQNVEPLNHLKEVYIKWGDHRAT
jgi:Leucine-rich repeat (LRR) protein